MHAHRCDSQTRGSARVRPATARDLVVKMNTGEDLDGDDRCDHEVDH